MILSDTTLYSTGQNRLFRLFESIPGFMQRDFTEHHHTAIEISYICSGHGIYRIRGKEVKFGAGDLFFFGTNEVHCITDVFEGEEMRLLNLHLEPRFLWTIEENLADSRLVGFFIERSQEIPTRIDKSAEGLASLLLSMRDEANAGSAAYDLMMKVSLLELLVLLMRSYGYQEKQAPKQLHTEHFKSVGSALDYIHENLSSPLSLDTIAAKAGMSRTYFCQIFKKLNGLSPWDYIGIKRIEKAQHMLRVGDKSVLDISYECGFNNISHFNRIFKRITGQTPSEYRKQQ